MRLSTPTYLVTLYLVLEMALGNTVTLPAQIDFHHPAAMPMDLGVGSVEWTKDGNPDKYLPEDIKRGKDGRPLAYRDLVMERIIKHAVSKYMVKVKNPLIFGWQRIKDPTRIGKKIHFTKNDEGLSLEINTQKMQLHGLSNLNLDYLRVIRHMGLTDAKVMLRLRTDLKLTGHYNLQGKVLGFIPVTGDGEFEISLRDAQIVAKTFVVAPSDNKMVLQDLDIQMTYADTHFNFANLMGGGTIGSTVNVIINQFGLAFVEAQKTALLQSIKSIYRDVASDIL